LIQIERTTGQGRTKKATFWFIIAEPQGLKREKKDAPGRKKERCFSKNEAHRPSLKGRRGEREKRHAHASTSKELGEVIN